ncbi:RNA polymerase sigma factor [Sinanaerobacter chloroacetimidivorans]
MRIILKRNGQTIEAAMNDYAGLIFTICYSMVGDYFEAEDLSQETFVAAYKNLERFDGENMKAWLVKIASNKCLDYLKSAGRRNIPSTDDFLEQVKDQDPIPEDKVVQKDLEKRMEYFCSSLKEPYQSIAFSYFCRNRNAQEIAMETGKNLKTVQTQIYRAKSMIRKLWKEEFG